jgi:hypothetical protein
MAGVTASSMRIESASSMIAANRPRWTTPFMPVVLWFEVLVGAVVGEHVVDERSGHARLGRHFQAIAEEIEDDLFVCGIGDVGVVGLSSVWCFGVVGDGGDGEADAFEARGHDLGVSRGEVVVDGEHVDASSLPGEERGGQDGGDGFAFPGRHFGGGAAGHGESAHDLFDVECEAHLASDDLGEEGEGVVDGLEWSEAGGVDDGCGVFGERGVGVMPEGVGGLGDSGACSRASRVVRARWIRPWIHSPMRSRPLAGVGLLLGVARSCQRRWDPMGPFGMAWVIVRASRR